MQYLAFLHRCGRQTLQLQRPLHCSEDPQEANLVLPGIFGRTRLGGSSLFGINSNSVLRIGWGWQGTSTEVVHVFRISGDFVKWLGVESGHIDLFTLTPK